MNILSVICYCATASAIIAAPFMLVNWVKYINAQPVNMLVGVRSGFPTKSVSFFAVSVLTGIITSTVITDYTRSEALNFLQTLPGEYIVYVNEQQVPEPVEMISALKELAPYWGHHSHPTKRIRVVIRSEERDLELELARDSGDPQEYWVFYTEHSVTSNNEIGRITTFAFDRY